MFSKKTSKSSLTFVKTESDSYEAEDELKEKLELTNMKLILPKSCEPNDIFYIFRNSIKTTMDVYADLSREASKVSNNNPLKDLDDDYEQIYKEESKA
jgi:hypothetical protein